MEFRAYGAAVLVGAGALWAMSGTEREQLVLGTAVPETLRALEARVALSPSDATQTRDLAQEYLDVRQPGLAIVLIEGAPEVVRKDVRVEHVYARALIDQGHNDEALAVETGVVEACGPLADGRVASLGCDPVLFVSAMRRTDILRELLSLGVNDARAQPEISLIAYQNATREARVAVE
jgi:hypothetical protein